MKRFMGFVIFLVGFGLLKVYGEVAAMKTGYEIRQLNIQKDSLLHDRKQLEYETAMLRTPRRLQMWLAKKEVDLSPVKIKMLARVDALGEEPRDGRIVPRNLAKLFLGTARAQSEK